MIVSMKIIKWVYLFLLIISGILLATFLLKTSNPLWPLSEDRQDWIDFAIFLSPIASLFTLGAILFTLEEARSRENKNYRNEKAEELLTYSIQIINNFTDFSLEKSKIKNETEDILTEILILKDKMEALVYLYFQNRYGSAIIADLKILSLLITEYNIYHSGLIKIDYVQFVKDFKDSQIVILKEIIQCKNHIELDNTIFENEVEKQLRKRDKIYNIPLPVIP